MPYAVTNVTILMIPEEERKHGRSRSYCARSYDQDDPDEHFSSSDALSNVDHSLVELPTASLFA